MNDLVKEKAYEIPAVAFLGPLGSYSHQAALKKFGSDAIYHEQSTIDKVFEAVSSCAVPYGLVPYENSSFGTVQQTLDSFWHLPSDSSLVATAEEMLIVHHSLLSNSAMATIKKVYSHPQALGQCAKWLSSNLPNAEQISTSSSSAAAKQAASELGAAAICSEVCSSLYSLNVIHRNIEDLEGNTTRFFVIENSGDRSIGNVRTLMYLTVDSLNPRALGDILQVLTTRQITIRRIESKPSGEHIWHYIYSFEVDGSSHDTNIQEAIAEISAISQKVRIVGSFIVGKV
ncbi:prephenate dehydratase [Batrachochytrium dendrobatidis]|nr:prephenate dehydratase [Batrachochytrium dendrobatidis]KAK5670099.1 prephenate dehydratase [Batrachochytrium dendrobatidis]